MKYKKNIQTPVVLLIFNRPDITAKVFQVIREIKPAQLLIIADGPRPDNPEDAELCNKTREIVDTIDWECNVLKNYADSNMGCKLRVASGLDWVFTNAEDAIILEDDCIPSVSFFQFCEYMLDRYRHDTRIMMISGTNIVKEWKNERQDYHFSYFGGIWGWATWKRAWIYYDIDMKLWKDSEIQQRIRDTLANGRHFRRRKKYFDDTFKGLIDTWDYQWSFARLMQSGLSIVPSKNLISNIGFGTDATHTAAGSLHAAALPLYELSFPLRENNYVAVDRMYDERFFNIVHPSLFKKIIKKIYNK